MGEELLLLRITTELMEGGQGKGMLLRASARYA